MLAVHDPSSSPLFSDHHCLQFMIHRQVPYFLQVLGSLQFSNCQLAFLNLDTPPHRQASLTMRWPLKLDIDRIPQCFSTFSFFIAMIAMSATAVNLVRREV
jgi:hypothetical protein